MQTSTERLGFSPDTAAEVSGIGRTKIFLAIKEGRLRARKFGRRTIITADDLKAFLDGLPVREAA